MVPAAWTKVAPPVQTEAVHIVDVPPGLYQVPSEATLGVDTDDFQPVWGDEDTDVDGDVGEDATDVTSLGAPTDR